MLFICFVYIYIYAYIVSNLCGELTFICFFFQESIERAEKTSGALAHSILLGLINVCTTCNRFCFGCLCLHTRIFPQQQQKINHFYSVIVGWFGYHNALGKAYKKTHSQNKQTKNTMKQSSRKNESILLEIYCNPK